MTREEMEKPYSPATPLEGTIRVSNQEEKMYRLREKAIDTFSLLTTTSTKCI